MLLIFPLLRRISQAAKAPRRAAPMTPSAMPAFAAVLKSDEVAAMGVGVTDVVVVGRPDVNVWEPGVDVWELLIELVVLAVLDVVVVVDFAVILK